MSYLDEDLIQVRRECIDLPQRCKSVLLASSSAGGELDVGCSPFVQLNDEFYLYINLCSAQTDDLMSTGMASVMFIEDEITSPYVFTRRRLTYRCDVSLVPRGYQYTRIMVAFQERFGAFMDILRKMPESQLFRITPGAGRYFNGLAQVFNFHGSRIESLTDASNDGSRASLADGGQPPTERRA